MSGAGDSLLGRGATPLKRPRGRALRPCPCRTKWELQVRVSDCIQLSLRGRKRLLTVEKKPGLAGPDFRKSRDGFVLYWPER